MFLDCPPAFGPLTVNALAAAGSVYRPRPGGVLRTRRVVAAARLDRPRQALGSTRGSGIAGILLTMVRLRARGSRKKSSASCAPHFGDLVFVQTVPPRSDSPGAEPRSPCDLLRPRAPPARRPTGRWRWNLSSAEQPVRRGLGRGLEVLVGGGGAAELLQLPVERAPSRTRASHGSDSSPRQPRASPHRSVIRASSSRSSCGRVPRVATRSSPASGGGGRRARPGSRRCRRSCATRTTAMPC